MLTEPGHYNRRGHPTPTTRLTPAVQPQPRAHLQQLGEDSHRGDSGPWWPCATSPPTGATLTARADWILLPLRAGHDRTRTATPQAAVPLVRPPRPRHPPARTGLRRRPRQTPSRARLGEQFENSATRPKASPRAASSCLRERGYLDGSQDAETKTWFYGRRRHAAPPTAPRKRLNANAAVSGPANGRKTTQVVRKWSSSCVFAAYLAHGLGPDQHPYISFEFDTSPGCRCLAQPREKP